MEQARGTKAIESGAQRLGNLGPDSAAPAPAGLAEAPASAKSGAAAPALMHAGDLGVLAGLAALGVVAWSLPYERWRGFARTLAPMAVPFVAGGRSSLASTIEQVGGDMLGQPVETVLREFMACHIERVLPYLRDYRPNGWQPLIRVLGKEQIDAALASGRGVVLWDAHFAFASLVTKLGLRRAGLWVSHLSHPRHGFSTSRFGMKLLNPVITTVERRYLGERVVLGLDDSKEALRRLTARLRAGGVVSVKVGGTAKRPLMAPFLNGEIPLGPGAPLLARDGEALLMPVFTLRDGKGGFTIQIEPPLDLPMQGSKSDALEAAARDYAKRLEPYVLGAPGQWLGWSEL